MKIILTAQEIIAKFGFPVDTEIELSTENEWISNIGRSRVGHPESLSADTKVEVKLRNGATEVGNAKYWYYQWIEVAEYSRNIDWDIIAYRVL